MASYTGGTNLVTKSGLRKERGDNFRSCGGLCGCMPIYIGGGDTDDDGKEKGKNQELSFSFYFCNCLFLTYNFLFTGRITPSLQFDNIQVFVDDQPAVGVVAVDGVVDVLGGGQEGRRVRLVQRVFYQARTPLRFRRQSSRRG